jgi:site-specific DNA-methyltransferase (adenine-specific)
VISLFEGCEARLRYTRELSALAPATLQEATSCQGEVASEYATLARKPLSEKSIAANVLRWGTGALNIDGCRIHADDAQGGEYEVKRLKPGATLNKTGGNWRPEDEDAVRFKGEMKPGRWPANLCHDGSDEVVAGFPETGVSAGIRGGNSSLTSYGFADGTGESVGFGDSGSAARYFYCAKATTEERGEGNNHPTVKPVALMRWLCRLVTPKGGTVLDPFMGSGSTALACDAEQFDFIGCELSPEYAAFAERRIRDAAGMFAEVKAA